MFASFASLLIKIQQYAENNQLGVPSKRRGNRMELKMCSQSVRIFSAIAFKIISNFTTRIQQLGCSVQ